MKIIKIVALGVLLVFAPYLVMVALSVIEYCRSTTVYIKTH